MVRHLEVAPTFEAAIGRDGKNDIQSALTSPRARSLLTSRRSICDDGGLDGKCYRHALRTFTPLSVLCLAGVGYPVPVMADRLSSDCSVRHLGSPGMGLECISKLVAPSTYLAAFHKLNHGIQVATEVP